MDVFLQISFDFLPEEISVTQIKTLIEKLLKIVDTCNACRLSFTASPKYSYVYYVYLVLHTSDRCSENGIIMALQSIEKMYTAHTEIVNTQNGTSLVTLNVTLSDGIKEKKWFIIKDNYLCNVMTRLNQKYACPYILENDNDTQIYKENDIDLSDIADVVTSTNGTRNYRVCLSDITIKNDATQTGYTLKLILIAPLVIFIGFC